MKSTSGVLLEDLVRPTSIQRTFSTGSAEIPAAVVYGSAELGELNESTLQLHIVSANAGQRHRPQQRTTGRADLRSE